MVVLDEHYTEVIQTIKSVVITKIQKYARMRTLVANHKWHLKEKHGMLCSLLMQDY